MIHTAYGHLDLALQVPTATFAEAPTRAPRTAPRTAFPSEPAAGRRTAGEPGSAGTTAGQGPAPSRSPEASPEGRRPAAPRAGEDAPESAQSGETPLPPEGVEGRLAPLSMETPGQPVGEEAATRESARSGAELPRHAEAVPQVLPAPALPGLAAPLSSSPSGRTGAITAGPGLAEARAEGVQRFQPQRLAAYRSPVQPAPGITVASGEAILKRIALFLDREGGEAILELNPPGLGRLAVQLVLEGKEVRLRVHASGEQVASFLERNLEPLRQALSAQGLEVDQIEVSVGSGEDAARFARETERRARAARSGQSIAETEQGSRLCMPHALSLGGVGATLDLMA